MPEYQNKYVSDILLKRPHETFVDDPCSLSEVNVAELVFDLEHNIKDINTLHLYHAVAILRQVVEDLIALGSNPEKSSSFRKTQLQRNSIDLEELEHERREREESKREKARGRNGDTKSGESGESGENNGDGGNEEGGDEKGNKETGETNNGRGEGPAAIDTQGNKAAFYNPSQNPDCTDNGCHSKTEGDPQICMQQLLQTTSFEKAHSPISQLCNERLRKEVVFHMQPQVQNQAVHLVRNFSLAKAPPISIEEFLVRIHTYSPSISVAVYIHSAYMLYKLSVVLGVVTLTPYNVHRFLLASLRCSTKKLEDVYQKQKSFATVGGLELRDLCRIEVSFLYLFNFQVIVSEALLNEFLGCGFVALHAAVSETD